MIKKETIRELFGAAFRDGCFFTLKSVVECLVEYAVKNVRTPYGRMAGLMADQLNQEEVKKAYEEKAEEYGDRMLAKIKELAEDVCCGKEITASWRRLPPVPGRYAVAYYGGGCLDGVGCHKYSERQIKELEPQHNILYFGPIPVAELLEDAHVRS